MTGTFDFPHFDTSIAAAALPAMSTELNLISEIVGTLSVLGCVFIIVVTLFLKKTKVIIGKMVMLLAVFDLTNHLPWFINSIHAFSSRVGCEVIGSWFSYFGFSSSVCFTTCIAHALYQSLKNGGFDCIERYFKKYLGLTVLPSLFVGTFSVILEWREYQVSDDGQESFCATRSFKGFNLGLFFLLLLPGIINLFGCTFYYFQIVRVLKRYNQKMHWGLMVYPLILIICISPAMIRRVVSLTGFDLNTIWVYRATSHGLSGAQGFLNSLAYGLSKEIYESFKKCCYKRKKIDTLLNRTTESTESQFQDGKTGESVLLEQPTFSRVGTFNL